MNMPADMLLMNQDDDFRLKQEERFVPPLLLIAWNLGRNVSTAEVSQCLSFYTMFIRTASKQSLILAILD